MAFDLTAADPLMKIHFNPRIVKQFNSAAVLFNRFFEGKGVPISNRGLEIPIHTAPNASFQWYTDGGTLPAGGGQGLNRSQIGFQSFAMAVQFTGAALDAAGEDAVTYAKALAFNIKNATVDAIKYLNIYSFLDGTGTLGTVGAATGTPSTTVNWTVDLTGSIDQARYLRPGMVLDFVNSSTGAIKESAPIVSIGTPIAVATGLATTGVTMGPATATTALANGDFVAVSGSENRVIAGLKLIVDDGTISSVFQNVNRNNVTQWKANVISLANSPALARDHLRRSIANIQIVRGSVNLDDLEYWSHPAQLHAYADMGWTLKRFEGGMKMDLGYTAFEWEGVKWVIDTDMPKDHLFLLDKSSMFKVTSRELSFDDRTGSVLKQVPSATTGQYADAFVAFLLFRGNIGCYSPNANTKVKGLAVPATY